MEPIGKVWPPPPCDPAKNSSLDAEVTVSFTTQFRFVEGSVPNFRRGAVRVSSEGLLLEGKSVLPYEYQVPVFLVGLLLPPLWIIAYLVMEYGLRHTELLALSWSSVRRVAYAGGEQMVCIVYDALNYKGIEKVYSLAFTLNKNEYDAFLACASHWLPASVGEGRLRLWTSPMNWAFGLFLLTPCVGFLLFILVSEIVH